MKTGRHTLPRMGNGTLPKSPLLLPLNIVVILLCLGAAGPLSCAAGATEPTFQIDGTFSMSDRAGKETKWTDFTACVSGSKYRISNCYFNGELLVSGSNGTNSFFLNKMANAPAPRLEFGKVSGGRFPANDLTPGQLCWLAFGARNFETNAPSVVPLEGFQENAPYLRCSATLSLKRPYLPRLARWYGSNYWHFTSGSTPLPYRNGFLAGEYVVTSITNFASLEFPLSFELKFFRPSFTGAHHPKDDVALAQTLRGRVGSIRSIGTIDDFRPELGAKAQVVDFRFPAGSNGDLLIIDRQNRKWPEPGDRNLAVVGIQQTRK